MSFTPNVDTTMVFQKNANRANPFRSNVEGTNIDGTKVDATLGR
jgi:hypothetical protein